MPRINFNHYTPPKRDSYLNKRENCDGLVKAIRAFYDAYQGVIKKSDAEQLLEIAQTILRANKRLPYKKLVNLQHQLTVIKSNYMAR